MLVFKLLIYCREADDLLHGFHCNSNIQKHKLTNKITVMKRLQDKLASKGFFSFLDDHNFDT